MKECHDYSELDLSPFENPADWNTYSRQISGCLVKTVRLETTEQHNQQFLSVKV